VEYLTWVLRSEERRVAVGEWYRLDIRILKRGGSMTTKEFLVGPLRVPVHH